MGLASVGASVDTLGDRPALEAHADGHVVTVVVPEGALLEFNSRVGLLGALALDEVDVKVCTGVHVCVCSLFCVTSA